ncbi:oxygenase MpaB family protein [Nocardia pseudovaccinii]|uniref:oxygenase MpaB family protein n=1 Tax=Nocardia pseudovaccinii TaxID=189540 RepID=UPI001FE11084|nr:oxygenase MpaB family protein [Nocardia pseudovaccinii]
MRYTHIGDPTADAVVAMFRQVPGEGRRMFETAVEHGLAAVTDPPPELVAFFDEIDNPPYWLDPQRIELACRAIGRTGATIGFTTLSVASLMGGYLAHRVSKTLTATADLEHRAPRRLASTTAWFTEVTTPGGLQRSAAGWKTTIRVRLMHAVVRAGLSRRPEWRHDEWDLPVNASQMAGTIMMFSLAHMTGCQFLGLHFSRRERDAIFHLWRYVGHLLGVPPKILPVDEHDTWRLMSLQAAHEFGQPDADSVRLTQALIRAIIPAVVGEGAGPLQHLKRQTVNRLLLAYGRLILGRTNSDFLGLPDHKPAQAVVITAAASIRILEFPRRLLPGATRWCETRGRRGQLTLTRRMSVSHGGARHSRHDHLATAAARHHRDLDEGHAIPAGRALGTDPRR